MNRNILALDFYGNTITAALVSLDGETDTQRFLHIVQKPCESFSGAFVRNMEGAKEELSQLLDELDEYATATPSVVVGVRGHFLSFQHRTGCTTVLSRGRIIREEEVDEVIKSAVPKVLSENMEVLDILPLSYMVDGNIGITDPKGMKGFILEAETFLTLAQNSHLTNLNNVLLDCGLTDFQLLPTAVALGEVLLTPTEKKSATLMVDIGKQSTSVLLYKQGILRGGWELDFGQDVLVRTAADLLQNDEDTTLQVLMDNPPGTDKYTDELWEEGSLILLSKLKKELLQTPLFSHISPKQIVFSGNGSNKLLIKFAEKIFSVHKARLAVFKQLISKCPTENPAYNGAISLLKHALERENKQLGVAQVQEEGFFDKFLSKFGLNSLF